MMDNYDYPARNSGLRKGAWMAEEDKLLRNCIEKHGEGKWHQVPQKAGLNRCRKSCRLRWLNYLKPNIKRGEFAEDEVDLIIRLHQLLGNRWSLIAGRLPGRTANDVKNYWNTHLHKKLKITKKVPPKIETESADPEKPKPSSVIRPRPRTFSENVLPMFNNDTTMLASRDNLKNIPSAENKNHLVNLKPAPECVVDVSEGITDHEWWPDDLFVEMAGMFSSEEELPAMSEKPWDNRIFTGNEEAGKRCLHDAGGERGHDIDIWGFFNSDYLALI